MRRKLTNKQWIAERRAFSQRVQELHDAGFREEAITAQLDEEGWLDMSESSVRKRIPEAS